MERSAPGHVRPPLRRPGAGDGNGYSRDRRRLRIVYRLWIFLGIALIALGAWNVVDGHWWGGGLFICWGVAGIDLALAANIHFRLEARGVATGNPFRLLRTFGLLRRRELDPRERRLALTSVVCVGLVVASLLASVGFFALATALDQAP